MNKKLIKESIQDVLNDMGYYQQDDGSWKHKKTDKILSDKHAQDIAGERAAREPKRKKEETTAAGLNPTDKDARKPGEESTRSESFDLFPKNDERLLREYIREQYEARGIYPTAREVQETYNQVMSLLEKTAEEARIEEHKARRGKPTKISPSSPARQPSDEEIRTRKSGIKSTDIIDMMNKLRKTNR
jgi:hypothetical protein